jgi:hypothetical protein
MTPCNDDPRSETWCCGDSKQCCGTLKGIQEVPLRFNHGVENATSSGPSSSSLSATATNTSTPTPGTTNDSSLGGGAIAGIVIGAVAGFALVLSAAFLILKRRRSDSAGSEPMLEPAYRDAKTYYGYVADAVTPPIEAPDSRGQFHELATEGPSRACELA